MPDIRYFFGWRGPAGDRVHSLPGPRSSWSSPDLRVLKVNSRHAGVDEVAFLVRVDGLVLFHGGDYQGRPARGAATNVLEDMRYLRAAAPPPDLMFLGAWTGAPYLEVIRGLQPKVLFPGHWRKREEKYLGFAEELRGLGIRVPVPCPRRRGDAFRYRGGKVEVEAAASSGAGLPPRTLPPAGGRARGAAPDPA